MTSASPGGKGANLGELTAAGLPGARRFVSAPPPTPRSATAAGCASRIAERLADVDVEDTEALERAAAEIRAMVEAEPMPDWLEDAIAAAYAEPRRRRRRRPVAVRSSATAEDTAVGFVRGHERDLPQRARRRRR